MFSSTHLVIMIN